MSVGSACTTCTCCYINDSDSILYPSPGMFDVASPPPGAATPSAASASTPPGSSRCGAASSCARRPASQLRRCCSRPSHRRSPASARPSCWRSSSASPRRPPYPPPRPPLRPLVARLRAAPLTGPPCGSREVGTLGWCWRHLLCLPPVSTGPRCRW